MGPGMPRTVYDQKKEGGRGLVSVSTMVQDETTSIHEYIRKMAPTYSLTAAVTEKLANLTFERSSRIQRGSQE